LLVFPHPAHMAMLAHISNAAAAFFRIRNSS
jgi:hypothetical protein